MASEILLPGVTTGQTLYAVISTAAGTIWNGSAFEAYNASNWTTYAVTMTEQGVSGRYAGTFPATITAGFYYVETRIRAGGSPAVGDVYAGGGGLEWSGSAVVPLSNLALASTALTSATWTNARAVAIDNLDAAVSTRLPTSSYTTPPTAAAVATAWGARVLGNSRTADHYLQGLVNRIEFAADGLSYTLYSTDDSTVLFQGTSTRLAATVGGLAGVNPT